MLPDSFRLTVGSRTLKSRILGGEFREKCVQSMCYNRNTKEYLVGFSHNDDPDLSTIVRLDAPELTDGHVKAVHRDLQLGHINDMQYAPNKRVYVARGDNTIAVLNSDLSLHRIITVDIPVWALARFPNGEWLLAEDGNAWRYDSDFRRISRINMNRLAADCLGYWQGAFIFGCTPYMIFSQMDDSGAFVSSLLVSPVDIRRCATPYETEGACMVGSRLWFVYGQKYAGTAVWDMGG